MSAKRVLLGTVAIVCFVLCAFVAFSDTSVDDTTCGSALIPRDPLESMLITGDPIQDALTEDRLTKICSREISRQRILAVIPLSAGIAAIIAGQRLRTAEGQ